MDAGLTLDDPSRFDLRGQLEFGEDCRMDINVVVSGTVKMGRMFWSARTVRLAIA